MKTRATFCISLLFTLLITVAHLYAVTEQEALADWNGLKSSQEKLEKMMNGMIAQYAPNIISDDDEAVLTVVAKYNADLKPELTAQLKKITDVYGTSKNDINTTMEEIVEVDWQSDKHPNTHAGQLYEDLKKHVDNIEKALLEKSDLLVRDAENVKSLVDTYATQATEENFAKMKSLLETAVKYNPNNEKAKEMLENVAKMKKEALGAIEKKIDEAKWPGHSKKFAGPGNPDKLAASAMEWLQEDEAGRDSKDPDHTFAVCVNGAWASAKKNILGETIQWGLPILGACYNSKDKEKGICRVFELTILTEEGGPDIKKAPPWTGVWVGDNYKMRIKNVRGDGVSGGAGGGRGFFGVIFWLALVGANLVAGLLAASAVLKVKVPQLEGVYRTLIPLRSLLGVIILAIGVVTLLFDILRIAPFADILPELSAIAAGILLGKEMIIAKAAGTKAEEKVIEVIDKQKEKLQKLEAQQIPIGFACLVLGILHFLIGGVIFF